MELLSNFSTLDTCKLINLIYATAHNARVHRQTCIEFASYLSIINNLLTSLHQSPHLLKHPPVQDALTMLHRTLVNAFLLAQNCERSSTLSSVFRNIPAQFKAFEMEIQKILSILNLPNLHLNWHITYNDTNTVYQAPPERTSASFLTQAQSFPAYGARHHALPARSSSASPTSGQSLPTFQSIPARSLSITWGEDGRAWQWVSRRGSRFREVAYVAEVRWLEVEGHISCKLMPGTYRVSWRLQMGSLNNAQPCGWESNPVLFRLFTGDHLQAECATFLDGSSGRTAKSIDCFVRKVADGWMEYDVGTFTTSNPEIPVDLTFSMHELKGSWKSGLFLDGVVIVQVSDLVEDTMIDAGLYSADLSLGLSRVVSFSRHPHDLELMKHPYRFTCNVCKCPESGVGYRCDKCDFDVHPHCAEESDSNFSDCNSCLEVSRADLLEMTKLRL
ncbi:hypothetical protein Mapa_009435 [Marchantia paleacea]|nr:hypothetical protein Mapa_009435 [Marchantia paleacea]